MQQGRRRPLPRLPFQPGRRRLHRQPQGLHRPPAGHAAPALLPAGGDSGQRSAGRRRRPAGRSGATAWSTAPATTASRRSKLDGHGAALPRGESARVRRRAARIARSRRSRAARPGRGDTDHAGISASTRGASCSACASGDFIADRDFPVFRGHRPALAASQRPALGHGHRQLRPRRRLDRIARRHRAACRR